MEMFRFTSTCSIMTTDGNSAPPGLVVEFPAYGPNMSDTGEKIRRLVQAKYGITIREKNPLCWFKAERI